MRKTKALRIAGFVGALTASAALVGTTVATTGAYFSDSRDGSIAGSSGHLKLLINQGSGYVQSSGGVMNLTYNDLMPGESRPKAIDYKIDVSSGKVDLWLVLDKTKPAVQAFTAGKSATFPDGGLGRYGFFKVSDTNGAWGVAHPGKDAFVSGNLAYSGTNTGPVNWDATTNGCPTDTDGRGGSAEVTQPNDPNMTVDQLKSSSNWTTPDWCGVPTRILLATSLTPGDTGTVTVTFGLSNLQSNQNQAQPAAAVPFQLVAVQQGARP